MLKTGFYPFFTNDDILLIGLIGLVLVLMNWWDLIRYGLQRAMGRPALPVLPRIRSRRHAFARRLRPGHRPVRHHA